MTHAGELSVKVLADTQALEDVAAIIAQHISALADELRAIRTRREEQE